MSWSHQGVSPVPPQTHPGRSCSKPQSLCVQQTPICSGFACQNSPWFTHSMCPALLVKCWNVFFLCGFPGAWVWTWALCVEGASFAFNEWMSEQLIGGSSHAVGRKHAWALDPPPPQRACGNTDYQVSLQSFWLSGSGGRLRICVYSKLPGHREPAGPEMTLMQNLAGLPFLWFWRIPAFLPLFLPLAEIPCLPILPDQLSSSGLRPLNSSVYIFL